MKIIIANHINDRDKFPRFWKIPEALENAEIKPYETLAMVQTQKGLKKVKVLKVIEHENNQIYDWKVDKIITVEQEVVAFEAPEDSILS
jgi:hypothetical protein